MSFFTNGGAEANENAIKLARWYTGRHKIVTRYRSYHGRHRRRDLGDWRPTTLARGAGAAGDRAHARPLHIPLPGRAP
jgi:glutamate-1-semialdehyde aminotransferase